MTVEGRFRQALFILGLEGLAILRSWWLDPEAAEARAKEMGQILAKMYEGEFPSITGDVLESDLLEGYAVWSETYDNLFNPVVEADERAVKPPALRTKRSGRRHRLRDGRFTKYVEDRGAIVIRLDQSPEMLARAREKDSDRRLCQAELKDSDRRLCQAELLTLPFPESSFDLGTVRPRLGSLQRA